MSLLDIHAKVGPDGVLTLRVPLGPDQANRDVRVVVESSAAEARSTVPPMTQDEWRDRVMRLAGIITDPEFRRHEQGELQELEGWP